MIDTPTNALSASLFNSLGENAFFSARFGLMGVGAVLAVARRGLNSGINLARRRLLVSLEIPSKDPAYAWLLEWLANSNLNSRWVPPRFGPLKLYSHELSVSTTVRDESDNPKLETQMAVVPGPGTHLFRWQNAWMFVKRERDARLMDMTTGTPWETITFLTLRRDMYLFQDLLKEAKALSEGRRAGKLVIYTAWGVEWRPFGRPKAVREFESVVLAKGVRERLTDDVYRFKSRRQWYARRGIPYRRGYLLHGPPGSGKSSFISALAGKMNLSICLLNLSTKGLTDDKLNHLLAEAPSQSIILLEDIDAAFHNREQTAADGYQSSVTFSGLLNALDGVASAESRLVFMTTNHVERLDPALIRPGRVDVMELIGDATPDQIAQLFHRFYGEKGMTDQAERIAAKLEAKGIKTSMAQIQGLFICSTAEEALKGLQALLT